MAGAFVRRPGRSLPRVACVSLWILMGCSAPATAWQDTAPEATHGGQRLETTSPSPDRFRLEQRTTAAKEALAVARGLVASGKDVETLHAWEAFFAEGHTLLMDSHTAELGSDYATWRALADSVGDVQAAVSATTAQADLRMALGEVSIGLGLLLEAESRLQVVAEADRDPWVELRLQRRLGSAALKARDWRGAERALVRAMALAEELGAHDERALAISFIALRVWDDTQRIDDAAKWAEGALRVLAAAKETDPLIDARTLGNCAEILKHAGQVERAEAMYIECLETSNDPSTRVVAHGQLGQLLGGQGRFSEARRHLQLSIDAAHGAVAEGLRLDAETALATLEMGLGNLDVADESFDRIIEAFEAKGRPDKSRVARHNRANILLMRQRYEEAESSFRTLAVEAERGDDPLAQVQALMNLGIAIQEQERFEEAEAVYRALVRIAEDKGFSLELAGGRIGLAEVRFQQGNAEGSPELLASAVEIFDSLDRPLDALFALEVEARMHLDAGRCDEADDALIDAERRIGMADVEDLLAFERASVRSAYAPWREVTQDHVLAATMAVSPEDGGVEVRRGPAVLEGWRRSGLWKGRALLEGVRASGAMELAAGLDRAAAQLSAASEQLAEGEALVDYCASTDRLLAYVLREGDLALIDLGERGSIEERAAAFASMLSSGDASSLTEVLVAGRALYEDLLAKVATHLDGLPARLVVAPGAELSRVPFEALVIAPEPEFVLDRSLVRYVPSSAVLCALGGRGGQRSVAPALLLGDAVYEAEEAAGTRAAAWAVPVLSRLPASRGEVVEIAKRLLLLEDAALLGEHAALLQDLGDGKVRNYTLPTEQLTLHLGSAVDSGCLDGSLEQYGLLHLAVHAVVHPEDPRRTGLVFSYDEETHGFIGLPRILELSLNDPVVVLSACRTADGAIISGEGVQSLAAAFLEAGARTAIASLWVVEDTNAAQVMDGFYKGWLSDGLPPAEALRKAKLALRHIGRRGGRVGGELTGPATTTRHPRLWATFILTGLD